MAHFAFFLATRNDPVCEGGRRWKMPLPIHGPAAPPRVHAPDLSSRVTVTYGDYFTCLRRFLKDSIPAILSGPHRQPSGTDAMEHIDVFLVKHGLLYHPSRIEVALSDRRLQFAANVAVTPEGCARLETEYASLKRLQNDFDFSYVPQVYAKATRLQAGRQPAAVFLAQWFESYHEFHVGRNPAGRGMVTLLWNSQTDPQRLLAVQQHQVYRQAARILTAYYNPLTFEHIAPWHHAAGDFVARVQHNRVDVKLIAARGYVPLLRRNADPHNRLQAQRQMLEALLVFLLQLSMRMRLDREDGVGQVVWLDEAVVTDTVEGFYDGLALACDRLSIPAAAQGDFRIYLAGVEPDYLHSLGLEMAARLFTPTEKQVLKWHLERHANQLHGALKANSCK